jgi:hypothetical protein
VTLITHWCPHHQDLMWHWWQIYIIIRIWCDIDDSLISPSSGSDVTLMTHWCPITGSDVTLTTHLYHHQDLMWYWWFIDVPIIRIWCDIDDTFISSSECDIILMTHWCPHHHQDLMWHWWHIYIIIRIWYDIHDTLMSQSSGSDVTLMTHWCPITGSDVTLMTHLYHHQDLMWYWW